MKTPDSQRIQLNNPLINNKFAPKLKRDKHKKPIPYMRKDQQKICFSKIFSFKIH